jgi:hypothetical protein
MDRALERKLGVLRADHLEVTGVPFSHFYCPILFRDEPADLCVAHIVNQSFRGSGKEWTVQRKDVDNFYGGVFEGDFVDLQHSGKHSPDAVIADPALSRKLRPRVELAGAVVQHFPAKGRVPKHFAEVVVSGPKGDVRLGLKIHPNDAMATKGQGWQIVIEKDIRLAALVSILKAAHLTMFEMLGYRYALSAGGCFLGKTVLGDFFLRCGNLSKAEALPAAMTHFRQFSNMMRPVESAAEEARGTISDGLVFVCRCSDETPWAFLVFIRTGELLHAALVPILETEIAAERFATFLRGDGGTIRGNRCRFVENKWFGSSKSETLTWPKGNFV